MFENWFRRLSKGFNVTAVHMRNVVSLQLLPKQFSFFHNQIN